MSFTFGNCNSKSKGKKVLLCCTGSVATIKLPELVEAFERLGLDVEVCLTECASKFCDRNNLRGVNIHTDAEEWSSWSNIGDPVLHIELAKWADVLLVAPLDANTLAKFANGLCDNLVTCVYRAWRGPKGSVIVAPAMNTAMWNHPVTAPQIDKLRSWGVTIVDPIEKVLACGDKGIGAMAPVPAIVHLVQNALRQQN